MVEILKSSQTKGTTVVQTSDVRRFSLGKSACVNIRWCCKRGNLQIHCYGSSLVSNCWNLRSMCWNNWLLRNETPEIRMEPGAGLHLWSTLVYWSNLLRRSVIDSHDKEVRSDLLVWSTWDLRWLSKNWAFPGESLPPRNRESAHLALPLAVRCCELGIWRTNRHPREEVRTTKFLLGSHWACTVAYNYNHVQAWEVTSNKNPVPS